VEEGEEEEEEEVLEKEVLKKEVLDLRSLESVGGETSYDSSGEISYDIFDKTDEADEGGERELSKR